MELSVLTNVAKLTSRGKQPAEWTASLRVMFSGPWDSSPGTWPQLDSSYSTVRQAESRASLFLFPLLHVHCTYINNFWWTTIPSSLRSIVCTRLWVSVLTLCFSSWPFRTQEPTLMWGNHGNLLLNGSGACLASGQLSVWRNVSNIEECCIQIKLLGMSISEFFFCFFAEEWQ